MNYLFISNRSLLWTHLISTVQDRTNFYSDQKLIWRLERNQNIIKHSFIYWNNIGTLLLYYLHDKDDNLIAVAEPVEAFDA